MSTTQNADELRAEHVRVLGAEPGRFYHELYSELFWLKLKWQEFLVLFAADSALEILNRAAASHFQMLQDVLSDDILLHIARLTDDPGTGPRRTLTFMALPGLLGTGDARLEELAATARDSAHFVRAWRNRRIAHRDLELVLGTGAAPLPVANREAIDEAVRALFAMLVHVEAKYFGMQPSTEVIEAPGGAESLLSLIRDGLSRQDWIPA